MKPAKYLIAALALQFLLLAWSTPPENTQAEKGKDLFARRCSGCHALDIHREGPRLRGVYGRQAAGLPDFAYSEALKKLNLRWDDASLERWLSDPDAMAPNSDMGFSLRAAEERRAVISYLKSLGRQ